MKILISSDDSAAAKIVTCDRGTDTSKQDSPQPKSIQNCLTEPKLKYSSRIIHLLNYNYEYLIASRLGGTVSIYEFEELEPENTNEPPEDPYKHLHDFQIPVNKNDKPVSLVKIETLNSILVSFSSGRLFLIHVSDFKFEPFEIQLPDTKPIEAFTVHPRFENIFAYGGKENDLKVIQLFDSKVNSKIFNKDFKDVFIPKILYQAKNVKNDHLDLRVPIWITNILFFNEETKDKFRIITSTKYGQIRLYDSSHGKKPTQDYPVSQNSILTLTFANEEQSEIIITDTSSLIAKYSLNQIDNKAFKTNSATAGDIIKPAPKLLGRYTGGNTGATVAVQLLDDIVALAGLDRYLRVFDVSSREIIAKVYVGVEVSSLIILDDEDEAEVEQKRQREEQEQDDDEMWNQLDKKQKVT
ncbi:NSA1 [Candida pseudojiufengensis]|uniref:NSA1 n=1 Tax=Candida pseudojiufengensis TaxID=497109 RepID=UPI002225745D|nr:NSA1 [Candida pseudojiufengensis]KAI5966155.1 NSA1 [Candida pseudojiufengensis]